MKRLCLVVILCWLAAIARPTTAFAMEVCINGPGMSGGTFSTAAVDAIIALHPRCVRIGYTLDVWNSTDDPTPRGPQHLTIFQAYDALVDRFRDGGVDVYMLLQPLTGPHSINLASQRAIWVDQETLVIDHFRGRVRLYELINEPNALDAANAFTNPPDVIAALLADFYTKVKVQHTNDPCWDVTLISGGLAGGQTDAQVADYLRQVYAAGIASHNWNGIKQQTGSFPLDGIAWHTYPSSTSDVAGSITASLSALWPVITAYEGAQTQKKIWISEIGFQTDSSPAGNTAQANALNTAYNTLGGDARIAMTMYFTYQDFTGGPWGLYAAGGFDAAHARPSQARFVAQASSLAEPMWGMVKLNAPAMLDAGAQAAITVDATNLGSQTWTKALGFGLAAGPGCPETPRANQIPWIPIDGYANSPTDARVFLSSTDQIAHGHGTTFTVPITAPMTTGDYVMGVRMVRDTAGWFGTPAEATIHVVGGSSGDDAGTLGDAGDQGSDGDSVSGARSGGCCNSGPDDTGSWVVVAGFVIALLPRRRLRRRTNATCA
jgi:hypothetical protein